MYQQNNLSIYQSSLVKTYNCHLLITFANSMDPDQAWPLLITLMVFLIFGSIFFKIRRQNAQHVKELKERNSLLMLQTLIYVINKGYFSDTFLFKQTESRGRILYFACSMAPAQINMCYTHLTKFTFTLPCIRGSCQLFYRICCYLGNSNLHHCLNKYWKLEYRFKLHPLHYSWVSDLNINKDQRKKQRPYYKKIMFTQHQ